MKKRYVVEATIATVEPQLCAVGVVRAVAVFGEEVWEYVLTGKGTPHREGVPHHAPLWLPKQSQHLSQVVDEGHEPEPFHALLWMQPPCTFRCLQGVVHLAEVRVSVRLVHDLVRYFEELHDGVLSLVESVVHFSFGHDDYLASCLEYNGTALPREAPYIIRYVCVHVFNLSFPLPLHPPISPTFRHSRLLNIFAPFLLATAATASTRGTSTVATRI